MAALPPDPRTLPQRTLSRPIEYLYYCIYKRAPSIVLPNSRANRGRWYQRLVTAACRLYDAQERAHIVEIPTPIDCYGAYRAGVPDNQLRVVERVYKLGGISGVLIGFQGRETIQSWWIPWPSAKAIASGEWTFERVSTLPGAIPVRFAGYIDFLPALK
jgi:hypothetical protein